MKTTSGTTPQRIKCYVINLDRATDRLAHLQGLLSGFRADIERVSAVDGEKLSADEVAHWQARSRLWAPLTVPEIACFLSHRKVWTLMQEHDEPWAFVCEDDIHVSADFGRFIETTAWLPEDADIVKAETMREVVEMSTTLGRAFGHRLRQLRSDHRGAAAYFVSRKAAARLLDLTVECCEPADRVLYTPEVGIAPTLNILQLDPALCIQDFHLAEDGQGVGFATQIPYVRGAPVVAPPALGKAAKLWRETKRPLFQFAALLSLISLFATRRSVLKAVRIELADGSSR